MCDSVFVWHSSLFWTLTTTRQLTPHNKLACSRNFKSCASSGEQRSKWKRGTTVPRCGYGICLDKWEATKVEQTVRSGRVSSLPRLNQMWAFSQKHINLVNAAIHNSSHLERIQLHLLARNPKAFECLDLVKEF